MTNGLPANNKRRTSADNFQVWLLGCEPRQLFRPTVTRAAATVLQTATQLLAKWFLQPTKITELPLPASSPAREIAD
jgi:hypothetical protein